MKIAPDRPSWRAALWLRRQRVGGRRRFIWRWLVPRFAVPVAVLATLVRAATEPFRWRHFLLHLVVNVAGAGVVGGYIAGTLLWEMMVAGGPRPTLPRSRRRERRRNGSGPRTLPPV